MYVPIRLGRNIKPNEDQDPPPCPHIVAQSGVPDDMVHAFELIANAVVPMAYQVVLLKAYDLVCLLGHKP